jgi:hypothetical protein
LTAVRFYKVYCGAQHIGISARPLCAFTEMAAESAAARLTVVKAKHMPGYIRQSAAAAEMFLDIRQHAPQCLGARWFIGCIAEN